MEQGNGQEVFEVRMLGEFSILYEGREIILGRKSTLKFVQMLQLVWLKGKKGIFKEHLAAALYEGKDLFDTNNSINNLLYQLRKQMVKAGVPKGDYISLTGRKYVTDGKFPVKLDVHEFEQHILCAQKEKDEQEQYRHYQAAFELYKGELLPASSTEIWVMEESMRLKKVLEQCVRWLGAYYAKQKDYSGQNHLYEQMVRLYPYDNWQIKQIDLMIEKGEYKNACAMYDQMVETYFEEMNMPPTPEMERCYERISQMVFHFPGNMDEVRESVWADSEEDDAYSGAYYCSYRSFLDICQLVSRNLERSGLTMSLTLCSLADYKGEIIQSQEKVKLYADTLQKVIKNTLRRGDVFTQYSKSQYLVLLVGTKAEDCESIYPRINQKMKMLLGGKAKVKYVAASLEELRPSTELERHQFKLV